MYTQNNEEELILNFFQNKPLEQRCVLDIGANDGKTFSNSLKVIELGWRGILFEPSPKALELLRPLHYGNPNVTIYSFAMTNEDGDFELNESASILNEGDTSLVSSLKQEETMKWRKANIQFSPVTIKGMKFDTFLKDSEIKKFNLITIDVEGFDYDVLSKINLTEVGCEMLIVEFNGKDEELFTSYVTQFGMKLIAKNPENLIFTK